MQRRKDRGLTERGRISAAWPENGQVGAAAGLETAISLSVPAPEQGSFQHINQVPRHNRQMCSECLGFERNCHT